MTPQDIPLAEIDSSHYCQIRGGLQEPLVLEYMELLRQFGKMDPVDLYRAPGGGYLTADGFHRVEAHRRLKLADIPAYVWEGDRSEALKRALYRNCRHGAALSREQKRKAAEMAVADPVLGSYTDRKLGFLMGVSASLIGQARRGETPASKARRKADPAPRPRLPKAAAAPAPAAAPVTVHERKEADNRPTSAMLLHKIEEWVSEDMIDESDVVALFAGPNGEYRWVPKPGNLVRLKVIDRTGRTEYEVPSAVVKGVGFEEIVLKDESESGRVAVN